MPPGGTPPSFSTLWNSAASLSRSPPVGPTMMWRLLVAGMAGRIDPRLVVDHRPFDRKESLIVIGDDEKERLVSSGHQTRILSPTTLRSAAAHASPVMRDNSLFGATALFRMSRSFWPKYQGMCVAISHCLRITPPSERRTMPTAGPSKVGRTRRGGQGQIFSTSHLREPIVRSVVEFGRARARMRCHGLRVSSTPPPPDRP